jgi:hypothetical protein
MNKTRILKHLFLLMFFIFIANMLALKFYWYSLIWYFDVIMHTLGGFWVGMFFLYVFERNKKSFNNSSLFFKVLFATLAVGILWEFYEFYIYQYISQIPFDYIDTSADIFFDLLGFWASYFYFIKFIVSPRRNRLQSIQ